jgi:hypothetical protein
VIVLRVFLQVVRSEGRFLNPAVRSGFFHGLECSRFCMGQSCLNSAFRKYPSPLPRPDQQKFNFSVPQPITHSRYLFPPTIFWSLDSPRRFDPCSRCGNESELYLSHESRVHQSATQY